MSKAILALAALGAWVLALAAAAPASAQAAYPANDPALNRFAIGVGGGTNGGSVELAYSINRYLAVRAQAAAIDFDADFKSSDTKYTGKLRHNTGGGLLDVHPFQNAFYVSGGFVSGERKVRVNAEPSATQTIRINGVNYVASQVVGVNGDVRLGDSAPLFGLGYDNTFTHSGHWGFRAFAGAIIGDEPKVTLVATGPFATNAVLQSNLAAEQASVQHDARDYKYYPVVSLGVFYRF